ncbi:MAG: DDE-type integrase/transposase/recombinase [Chitinophagales bacterium]|nr:DDE-type integrase/transposase/recombinase [Chitinophagales bacterium]
MGRDKFEAFCKRHGFASKRYRDKYRTTDSTGVVRFPDLTIGLELERINQLWVSDITYYQLGQLSTYITFIMDAYSRMIIGYKVSKRLFTEQTTLAALEMAVKNRKHANLQGTIFHSDGGGQYYDKEFLNYTHRLRLHNSMCMYAWENGKAERLNGVIKNNYLRHRDIKTFEDLEMEVRRSVRLYNQKKPHSGLNRLTPFQFESLYISSREKSGGEKSTTEKQTHGRGNNYSPRAVGRNPMAQISLRKI